MADLAPPTGPVPPAGFNHLVLHVRDLDESHAFWTGILGFTQVGTLRPAPHRPAGTRMQFYSLERPGKGMSHHELALVENKNIPAPPAEWGMFAAPTAINHIAIKWADRDAWLAQLRFMQSRGVKFQRRTDHGMTHSVYVSDPNGYGVEVLYELPREVWEGDIDAALNYAVNLPTEGEAALEDNTNFPVFAAE